MKKYWKEIIILFIQLLIFYLVPLFTNSYDVIGMVLLMILLTFILSIIFEIISSISRKYLYSIVIAIMFIPSVFIYYNDSALIHVLWYFVVSLLGLGIGFLIIKIKKYITLN